MRTNQEFYLIEPHDISDDSVTTERLPDALNISISIAAVAIAALALWIASNSDSWIAILLAATVFSFVNNTIFSLLHEVVVTLSGEYGLGDAVS